MHGWRVGISCARCWCDGVRSRPGSRLMDLDLYMESTLNVSLCKGTLSCFSRSAFRSSRFSLYPMFFSSHLALLRFSDSFERMRIFFITRTVAKVMSGECQAASVSRSPTWIPKRRYFFLVISHMTFFFGSYGIYAKISNSKLHACCGNRDTNIFPICFQYVFNIVPVFFNIFSILSNLATFQSFFNMFPIFIDILQTCHLSPHTAKYGQMTQKKLSFLQIRQYSVK